MFSFVPLVTNVIHVTLPDQSWMYLLLFFYFCFIVNLLIFRLQAKLNRRDAKIERLRTDYVLPYQRFKFNKALRSSYITVASIQRVKHLKSELKRRDDYVRFLENRVSELEEELGQSVIKCLKQKKLLCYF